MRAGIRSLIIVLGLATMAAASYNPILSYWNSRNRLDCRFVEVTRGDIAAVVNATGTVHPVRSVQVGSFVSGPVQELYVDFNTPVKKGDLLAKIDPRIYQANVARDRAVLATRQAEVERVQANLQQAINAERRALALRAQNRDYISREELDELTFKRQALQAEVKVAEAAVLEAQANLQNSEANLGYTEIRSPVDGLVIERVVDQGQTVAAVFQTPKLFVVAPDLDKEVYIHASVDEADIGLIRNAQKSGEPVRFTVDAYPDVLFEGKILQIRMSSSTTQNVVTYPVVISTSNPEMRLLPGMTTTISFQIDEHKDVLKIPNAALRFYPNPDYVHPADRKLLQGYQEDDEELSVSMLPSASQRVEAGRNRSHRHVWVVQGDSLRAVEVVTGLSDHQFTELVSGELQEGQDLVVDVQGRTGGYLFGTAAP